MAVARTNVMHFKLRKWVFLLVWSLFVYLPYAGASLRFEQTMIEDIVPPGDKTYAFTFPFEK